MMFNITVNENADATQGVSEVALTPLDESVIAASTMNIMLVTKVAIQRRMGSEMASQPRSNTIQQR